MDQVKLTDVYGINRDVPLNYTTRDNVDGALVGSLTRDQHLVIYGSSKQGKTCLRKWNLEEKDYIVITCSNRWDLGQLHAAILKQAGFTVEQSTTKTVSGSNKILAKFTASFGLFGKGVSADAGGDHVSQSTAETTRAPIELDSSDVNDVVAALKSIDFSRYLVLEDFHYLSEETQKDFAVALKAFHENSKYCFIIVGVWLDENRLIQYNGDLTGRVTTINADAWLPNQLQSAIRSGEALLNITFDSNFKHDLIAGSLENIYIVQEGCFRACEAAGVFSTSSELKTIAAGVSAAEIIKTIVDAQSGRYQSFLTNFSAGFMDAQLQMYKWILYTILCATSQQLERGLTFAQIKRALRAKHPQGSSLNPGNITQALRSAASLQVKQNIKPIVLDYNQSVLRLDVVDRGFLIWLNQQDKTELLRELDLPELISIHEQGALL